MSAPLPWVSEQFIGPLATSLPLLLAGTTGILTLGLLGTTLIASPAHRQRFGEMTLAATLLWLVVAAIPLPRLVAWTPDGLSAAQSEPFVEDDEVGAIKASGGAAWKAPAGEVRGDSRTSNTDSPSAPFPEAEAVPASPAISTPPPLAPQSPIPATAVRSPILIPVATALLAGSAAAVLWLVVGQCALWWTCRAARPADARVQHVLAALPPRWRPRRVRLLVSPRCRQPFSVGLLRPRIVLPDSLGRDAPTRLLRHVLLHELVHLRRGDGWGHLVANGALPVLWFHPLYWWLRGQVHADRELVADDVAAAASDRAAYVADLLHLAGGRRRPLAAGLGVLGIFRFRSLFYRRMAMLIDRTEPLRPARRSWQLGTGAAAVAVALGLGLVAGRPLAADGPNDPAATKSQDAPKKQVQPAAGSPRVANQTGDQPGTSSDALPSASAGGLAGGTPGGSNPASGQAGGFPVDVELKSTLGVGLVAPAEDIQVPARVAGPIVGVEVRPGDRVKKGDRLAQLDARDMRQKIQAAEAALAADLAGSDIAVRYAEKEFAVAEEEMQRVKKLAESGAASAGELNRQRRAAERAKLQVETAQAERAAHRRAVEVKATELSALKEQAEDFRVIAPIDGLVVSVAAKPGEWAAAGKPLARIVQLDTIIVTSYVNSRKFNPEQLVGREVVVDIHRAGGKQERFKGKIDFVSPLVQQGDYIVRALVQNRQSDGQWVLRPGMNTSVRLAEK